MTKKYEPADLIRIHRAEILDEFTRLGFLRPQVVSVTLKTEFSAVLMAAQFPTGIKPSDRAVIERNIGRLIGKAVMLRDKRNKHRDKILQAAELESF